LAQRYNKKSKKANNYQKNSKIFKEDQIMTIIVEIKEKARLILNGFGQLQVDYWFQGPFSSGWRCDGHMYNNNKNGMEKAMLNFYQTLLLFTNYELAEEIERQVKAI
jgi:hypothetical protein